MTTVLAAPQAPQVLRWAGDPEGGAPFLEADPADPGKLAGFDVEIAAFLAAGLGRDPEFVFITFSSLDQSITRGDADVALGGIEDTPTRRVSMATTIPYYQFREVLAVRDDDMNRIRGLSDLRGKSVATLGGTIAYEILMSRKDELDLNVLSYDDDVHPYEDLLLGRVDAVLLDDVLAQRRQRSMKGFGIVPGSIALGHYVGVLAPANAPLRDSLNEILREAMRDGTLERIFRKWDVWNDDQARLYGQLLRGEPVEPVIGATLELEPSRWLAARRYLPSLLRAALLTLVLSCLSMGLAIVVGVLIACGRVYGSRIVRAVLLGYVELMRGTPLLLQLFVLYYGLASAVRLPAFAAAFIGLALNYGAYESEIYRAALQAVSPGQLDAARILGLTERQVLTLVRGPQAFRLALAPMTNDFVALLKDSSLVSVLTVMELTKQTQIFATNIGSWVLPGMMCAALYLAMSLPLSALARRLERRWSMPTS
jgi:polar amino acid transport system substrate-binding protein